MRGFGRLCYSAPMSQKLKKISRISYQHGIGCCNSFLHYTEEEACLLPADILPHTQALASNFFLKGKKLLLIGEMPRCFILVLLKELRKHLLQIVQQCTAEKVPSVNHWKYFFTRYVTCFAKVCRVRIHLSTRCLLETIYSKSGSLEVLGSIPAMAGEWQEHKGHIKRLVIKHHPLNTLRTRSNCVSSNFTYTHTIDAASVAISGRLKLSNNPRSINRIPTPHGAISTC